MKRDFFPKVFLAMLSTVRRFAIGWCRFFGRACSLSKLEGQPSYWGNHSHRVLSTSIRVWFCVATAIIAAAIADPCIEFASNAGWFGPGRFTDGSNLDVVPALLVGLAVIACYVGMRIREVALGLRFEALNRRMVANHTFATDLVTVLLAAFSVQLLVLFAMETAEQALVYGQVLGGWIWLGGPLFASLTAHGLFCILTALALATLLYRFERNAGRIAHFILYAGRRSREAYASLHPHKDTFVLHQLSLHSRIGERAPPLPAS